MLPHRKSDTYAKIRKNVQIAEFLLLKNDQKNPVIWIIEAKSSSPKPGTQSNFDKFINEIRNKLINAFSLGMASCLNRHPLAKNELPMRFRKLNLAQIDFKFVLVINGHKDEWLIPLQEALNNALRTTIKTWALNPLAVVVLNEVLARKHGLVQG